MILFQRQPQEGSWRGRLRREPGAGDPRRLELAEPEATQPDELEGEERAPRERQAKAKAEADPACQRQREEAERQRQKPETLAAVGGAIELAQRDPGDGTLTAALESIEALVSPELMLTGPSPWRRC